MPADGRATDVGVLMHNVATAYAVHQAVRLGRPLVSRIVTVSGRAVDNPVNLEVPIGTLMGELLRYCGWRPDQTQRLLMGGPMMGDALPHADVPV
ncbi:SLBB domain-containing protein, partial [Methylogaea oryzae]|uniref:SLBB domain-containing protein n=1 Tax=Methylogaea oryzae TaxID=1295382 RepID=UPI000ACC3E51